ncbi:MAG: hypothetical protein Q4G09_03430 [Clostridia bacterium]|nr:hypothetical protein [Clostridia bacterium]
MSSLVFTLETLNPNLRTTFFKHKNYTDYIANSEFVIRNKNTEHGLFGIVNKFPNIQEMESIDKLSDYITNLADNKVPIYRGLVSLEVSDAERLGYYKQEKWKGLLENKLPSIAEKLNIKYENMQYVGSVHWEGNHPHLQFMLWSKSKQKSNYFVKYQLKDKLRKEFINDVFREDLLPIYKEKDLAKKNIIISNDIIKYLKENPNEYKLIKSKLKDNEIKQIVEALMDLKKDLQTITGSIKYKYLLKYPEIIKKIDWISNNIILSSAQCQIEIDKYIKAKCELLEFQYTDKAKLEEAKENSKQEAKQEILKLIGNQILDIERKWLNNNEEYTYVRHNNETRDLLDTILTILSYQVQSNKKINRNFEMKYRKNLSKQAKKELAKEKQNSSEFNWDEY